MEMQEYSFFFYKLKLQIKVNIELLRNAPSLKLRMVEILKLDEFSKALKNQN